MQIYKLHFKQRTKPVVLLRNGPDRGQNTEQGIQFKTVVIYNNNQSDNSYCVKIQIFIFKDKLASRF